MTVSNIRQKASSPARFCSSAATAMSTADALALSFIDSDSSSTSSSGGGCGGWHCAAYTGGRLLLQDHSHV